MSGSPWRGYWGQTQRPRRRLRLGSAANDGGSAARSGKSSRLCAPTLCSRCSAETAIISATAAGSAAGPSPKRRGLRARPTAARERRAVAGDAGGARDRIGRTGAGSAGGGASAARSRAGRARRRALDRAGDDRAKTAASVSELLASRFAPWRPVEAASPHAQRPATELRPSASTAIPPM